MQERQAGYSNLTWRRALSCSNGACVEVAASGHMILIKDSKLPAGPVLSYTTAEFREFIAGAKNGDFDDLVK